MANRYYQHSTDTSNWSWITVSTAYETQQGTEYRTNQNYMPTDIWKSLHTAQTNIIYLPILAQAVRLSEYLPKPLKPCEQQMLELIEPTHIRVLISTALVEPNELHLATFDHQLPVRDNQIFRILFERRYDNKSLSSNIDTEPQNEPNS